MKYNKSEIMKRAWTLVKSEGQSKSAALTQAWAEAKAPKAEKLYIKNWFEGKLLSQNFQAGAFLIDVIGVVKETEKAYLLKVEAGYSADIEEVKNVWCPKSCTMTESEKEAEEQSQADRFEASRKAYEKLLAFAKAHNVKGVRKGMRKATIIAKIEAAGLDYAA